MELSKGINEGTGVYKFLKFITHNDKLKNKINGPVLVGYVLDHESSSRISGTGLDNFIFFDEKPSFVLLLGLPFPMSASR